MKILKFMPLIGIILLCYIISKIGVANFLGAFAKANYLYLFLMLLTFLPLLLLQGYKWNYLLKKQNINLKFLYVLKLQIISVFYELVTPGRVGSFIKIAYLQEKTHNLGKSASSVVIDRALDFLTVALLAFLGSLSLISKKFNVFYICIIVFLLFIVGFIVLINKKAMNLFARFFYILLLKDKFKNKAKKSFDEFYKNMPSLKSMFVVFILTVAFWVLVYTQAYLSALGFGVKIPYLNFLIVFPISVIISLVPITVSGFGAREAVLLLLLGSYAEKQQIVAFSIVWAGLSLVVNSVAGVLLIYKKSLLGTRGNQRFPVPRKAKLFAEKPREETPRKAKKVGNVKRLKRRKIPKK